MPHVYEKQLGIAPILKGLLDHWEDFGFYPEMSGRKVAGF